MNLELALTLGALCLACLSLLHSKHPISHIPGPSGSDWLLGHLHFIAQQTENSSYLFAWTKSFGSVFRLKGVFQRDILYIANPKALHYILHQSTYRYPKAHDDLGISLELFGGSSLISCRGAEHHRQRRVVLPCFSIVQLRSYLDNFQDISTKLSNKWQESMPPQGQVFNVSQWLARATLDIVGATAFGYRFNALEDSASSELGEALKDLFLDSQLYPDRTGVLFKGLLRELHPSLLRLVLKFPTREYDRYRKYFELCMKVVGRIIEERREAGLETSGDARMDILGVMLRANAEEDPARRLSDAELVGEITLVILAGHDTTASTMSFILWELAKNQDVQSKLRQELATRRQQLKPGANFTSTDYESLPLLNAVIKETLRFHPIVSYLTRSAAQDDVLPLSEPILTKKGPISDIPIAKNQHVIIGMSAYNRLTSVWGEDANEWNPSRWTNDSMEKNGSVKVGMTSNMMTFSAGVQGCIGWKFSMMEMQVLLTHLTESFEFNIPKGNPHILRLPTGVMFPAVEGELEKGAQMPLFVKPVEIA